MISKLSLMSNAPYSDHSVLSFNSSWIFWTQVFYQIVALHLQSGATFESTVNKNECIHFLLQSNHFNCSLQANLLLCNILTYAQSANIYRSVHN